MDQMPVQMDTVDQHRPCPPIGFFARCVPFSGKRPNQQPEVDIASQNQIGRHVEGKIFVRPCEYSILTSSGGFPPNSSRDRVSCRVVPPAWRGRDFSL